MSDSEDLTSLLLRYNQLGTMLPPLDQLVDIHAARVILAEMGGVQERINYYLASRRSDASAA